MVKIVKSPGSATIINAIATGYGSAFGIDLRIKAEARFGKPGIQCSSDLGADPKLMNICVKNVLNHYDIEADKPLDDSITNLDFGTGEGIDIKTESNLPLGSGLSSSSGSAVLRLWSCGSGYRRRCCRHPHAGLLRLMP